MKQTIIPYIIALIVVSLIGFYFHYSNYPVAQIDYNNLETGNINLGFSVTPYCNQSKIIIYSSHGKEEILPNNAPVSTKGLQLVNQS